MDLMSPPPLKKIKNNIPVIECKREFTLPHKFPSKVSSSKCTIKLEDCGKIVISSSDVSNNRNKKDTNDIKTLRLQTQDGKDLGKIKVKLLARRNETNTQKIISDIQTIRCRKNTPENFFIGQTNSNKILSSSPSKSDAERSQNSIIGSQIILKSISPTKLSTVTCNKLSETQNKPKGILQKHCILTKVNNINESNKVLVQNKNKHKLLHNAPILKQTVTPKNGQLVLTNEENSMDFVINKHTSSNKGESIVNENMYIEIKPKIIEKINTSNIKQLKTQLIKSKFPIVECEKLPISKNKNNVIKMTASSKELNNRKQYSSSDIRNYSSKKIVEPNENVHCIKLKKSMNKRNNITILRGINSTHKSCIDNTTNNIEEQNCISVFSEKNVDNKNQNIIVNNKIIPYEMHKNVKIGEKIANTVKEKELSEYLNVIKEAITTVKDRELRAKALHALTECGISKSRQIPIVPSEKLKTVNDSQIQTDVFGLLDMENFVLIKKDMPLERLKQSERSTINPVAQDVHTQTEMQIQSKTTLNYSIDNIDFYSTWNSVPMQDTIDFDNYFNDYFNDNADVSKVKAVLSTPYTLCKKVAMQLQKDYEELQHWDDNGMLNIHRAVLNDQLQEIQRLLLVLEASKTNVDVLTESGMTSLELAIKFGTSKNVVTLLLETGAKPVSSDLLHESAIVLASKLSSPCLSLLLDYVTDCELLNKVDSTGFSPLHYCAFNGYLDGVNALIQHGAEVNLKDNRSGRTPFFHALENNHMSVAQKLLLNGAIADLPNFSGQSVLSLMNEVQNFSLKAALKKILI